MTDIGTGVSQSTAVEKNPEGAPKGNGNARKPGLNTLKHAVTKLGSRAQRQKLADGFAKYLSQLSLERHIKTKTINDILNEETEPEDHHGKGAEPRQWSQAHTTSFASDVNVRQ